jgi:hypothetical protein
MKKFLFSACLLFACAAHAQSTTEVKCIMYKDLVSASALDTAKLNSFFLSSGYEPMGTPGATIMFRSGDAEMITFKRNEKGDLTEIVYNTTQENCFKSIESELAAAGFKSDIKWEGGASASTGYKSAAYGVFMYKATTFVENEGQKTYSASYIITIYPLEQYNSKREKYKSNPKLKITEF